MLIGLPSKLERDVRAFAKEVQAALHKGTAYNVDDEGQCHIRGEYGNAERSAYAYTKTEAEQLRRMLKQAGFALPLDTVEGILTQALASLSSKSYHNVMESNKGAERQKRFQANRPEGICARCPRYRMVEALPDRTLCADCMAKETERVKAWRARRREAKSA